MYSAFVPRTQSLKNPKDQEPHSHMGENEKSAVACFQKSGIPRKRVASPDKRVALQDQGIALDANATLLASRQSACFHAAQVKIRQFNTLLKVLPCLKSITGCFYQLRKLANVLCVRGRWCVI